MPLQYEINLAEGYVHVVGTGMLLMPEMIAVVDEVAEDPAFQPGFRVLFDLRNGDYNAELRDGDAFVSALKRRMADFQDRFALIVPEHLHFLAKLYSVLAEVGGFDRMKCFTDFDEARKWCGLRNLKDSMVEGTDTPIDECSEDPGL